MTQSGTSSNSKFDDLKTRTLVAVVFAVIGFIFIWLGGAAFSAFMACICAVMLLEFTRLVKPEVQLEGVARMAMIVCGTLSVFLLPFSGLWFTIIASLGVKCRVSHCDLDHPLCRCGGYRRIYVWPLTSRPQADPQHFT